MAGGSPRRPSWELARAEAMVFSGGQLCPPTGDTWQGWDYHDGEVLVAVSGGRQG